MPKKQKTYYSAMLATGVVFFLFAAMTASPAFYLLGLALAVIGIVNKDKWKDECKIDKKTMLVTAVVAVLVAFALAYFLR